MTFYRRGELQFCPECRQKWPKGAEFDIRSFRWLNQLPRSVSPSNIDCVIHDGADGRNRFLILESKKDGESIEVGQAWLLRSLAGMERAIVRVLSGTPETLAIHAVTSRTIEEVGTPTTPALIRSAVVSWLNGALWRDVESGLRVERQAPVSNHLCKWAHEEDGLFVCDDCGRVWQGDLAL